MQGEKTFSKKTKEQKLYHLLIRLASGNGGRWELRMYIQKLALFSVFKRFPGVVAGGEEEHGAGCGGKVLD